MLAHFLLTLLFTFLLDLLPLKKHIRDTDLTGNLLIQCFSCIGHHQTELAVSLLGQDSRHLLGRLRRNHLMLCLGKNLLSHLVHDHGCCHGRIGAGNKSGCLLIFFGRENLLHALTGLSCFLRSFLRRLFADIFAGLLRILSHGFDSRTILGINDLSHRSGHCFALFPDERKYGCALRRHFFQCFQHLGCIVDLRSAAVCSLLFRIGCLRKLCGGFLYRHPGLFLLAPLRGHLGLLRLTLCGSFRPVLCLFFLFFLLSVQYFPQSFRKCLLQIDGIALVKLHGFYFDIQFRLLRRLRSVALYIGLGAVSGFLSLLRRSLSGLFPGRLRHSLRGGIKPMVVLFLLGRGQRLVQHFQLHGPGDIFPLTKPEDQLIALLYTAGRLTGSVIQKSKLVRPFFSVVSVFQLLEYRNTLLETYPLRLIQFVLQNISAGVGGRRLYILGIILRCLPVFLHFQAKLAERIADGLAAGSPLIRKQQKALCILVSLIDLIQVADGTKHHHTLDSAPVDAVRDLCRLCIISF